jgi:hypothetical protein
MGALRCGNLAAQARLAPREVGRGPIARVDLLRATTTQARARLERHRKISRYIVVNSTGEGADEKRAWLRVLGIRDGPLEARTYRSMEAGPWGRGSLPW